MLGLGGHARTGRACTDGLEEPARTDWRSLHGLDEAMLGLDEAMLGLDEAMLLLLAPCTRTRPWLPVLGPVHGSLYTLLGLPVPTRVVLPPRTASVHHGHVHIDGFDGEAVCRWDRFLTVRR